MRDDENDGERGMTLVELIVGMGISAAVAILAAFMLINAFASQATVTSTTAASTRAQAISAQIAAAVRTAARLQVVAGGTELDVLRSDGVCESFRVLNSTLQHRTGSGTWGDLSSYAPVTFAVSPIGSPSPSPYFATPAPPAPAALSYGFRLAASSGSVEVASVAVPRTATTGGFPCP